MFGPRGRVGIGSDRAPGSDKAWDANRAPVGALEAFLLGGFAGGAIALVAFLALASTAKGRSSTAFFLPAGTAAHVLQVAQSYFQQHGMRVKAMPDGLAAEEGSEWATGVRVLELRVRDREGGGADVWIGAYIRGFYPKEIHIDPKALFGMIPRRKAFGVARGLAGALGAPGATWQHRRA